jgi:hypothetical protein
MARRQLALFKSTTGIVSHMNRHFTRYLVERLLNFFPADHLNIDLPLSFSIPPNITFLVQPCFFGLMELSEGPALVRTPDPEESH